MIQTQFAHTINVPDEWEHEGHTFQVFQDEYTECPTEWLDSDDALCVSSAGRMVASCITLPKRTALQCGSLTTTIRGRMT